jgi:hypothetical protein
VLIAFDDLAGLSMETSGSVGMPYLVPAGLLCVVNPPPAAGVIRRGVCAGPVREEGLSPGDRRPEFAAATTDGMVGR